MPAFDQQQFLSSRVIPGLTPNHIISHLTQIPLLHIHWKKNKQQQQRKLVDVMLRMPSRSDSPGFIYGFKEKEGYNSSAQNYLIKIGRTRRNIPQQRIFQWEKADKHQYFEMFTIRTQYNNKLELLMHCLFDYAREIIFINNQKRIQWFRFHEKVATASAVNYMNLMMEEIHQKYIEKLQQPVQYPYYGLMVERLLNKYINKEEEQNIVAFGLPKSGKSVFGNILLGDQVLAQKSENGLQIIINSTNQNTKNYIEMADIEPGKNPQEIVQNYFSIWQKLCCSKKILPLLVVKQSDIESSKLIGLTQGLRLHEQYIQNTNRMLMVVTQASQGFTPQQAKSIIQQNKQFLNETQLATFLNSQYILIKKAQSPGPLITSTQLQSINLKILSWREQLQKQNKQLSTIEFKIEKEHLNTCNELIQKSYEILQPIYAQRFCQRVAEYLDEDLQADFVQSVNQLLLNLKQQSNQTQQAIHRLFTKLLTLLELTQQEQVQTYLYIFCQFCANNTMIYSLITAPLSEKVNEKLIDINNHTLNQLDIHLEGLKNSLGGYNRCHIELIPSFMQIRDQNNLEKMIEIFKEITQSQNNITEETIGSLIKSIEILLTTLTQINGMIKKGFRLDSTLGRIRQAIYYGLKTQQQLQQIKLVQPYSQLTESQTHASLQLKWNEQSIDNLSSLQKKITEYKQGSTVINAVKEFIIDGPPKEYSIKHNIFILAKDVKVYKECSVSFKGINKGQKKKLNLMIVSENYHNIKKLAIPKQSSTGEGYILTIQENQIIPIWPEHKQIDMERKNMFLVLKKLYESKIK